MFSHIFHISGQNIECAPAHSGACGGRLRYHHCTPQCASCRRLFYNLKMHFLIIKKTPFILTKGDWFAVPPLLYRRNSSIHLILFFNGNDSGTAYCDFSVPAPKLPSASLFSSASQPMGISLCQNDLCILLFFNAFNWFINHETTKYHSHRSPVCQGF